MELGMTQKEEGLYKKSNESFDAKGYDTTLKLTDKLLKINPENPVYHIMRGNCYAAMNDLDNCLVCCEKAWEYKDKGYLSDVYLEKLEEYIANLKHHIQTQKEDSVYETAVEAIESRDYSNAISIVEGLLKVNNVHPLYHYALALCQSKRDQFSEALMSYKRALENDGKRYSMEDGFRETVIKEMTELSSVSKAYMSFSVHQYEDAIANFDALLEMYPNSGHYYFMRGMCNEKMGATIAAEKDYETALKYGLKDTEKKHYAESRTRPKTKPETEIVVQPLTMYMKEEEINDGIKEKVPLKMPSWNSIAITGIDENKMFYPMTIEDLIRKQKENPDIDYKFPLPIVDFDTGEKKLSIGHIGKRLTKRKQPETESQRKRRERNKRYYDKKRGDYDNPWKKYRDTHKAEIKVKNSLYYLARKLDSGDTTNQQRQQNNPPMMNLPLKKDRDIS